MKTYYICISSKKNTDFVLYEGVEKFDNFSKAYEFALDVKRQQTTLCEITEIKQTQ